MNFVKKILVIKLRHHGDVLLSTALFNALAELFPHAKVDAVVYSETTPLLLNNPHVHKVLRINRALKGVARLKTELALIRTIRANGYDAVIHLTDQWIGALIAAASQAPIRVEMAFQKRNNALWHACFTHRIAQPPRGQAHAVELNLLCLQALGVNPSNIQGKMVLVPSPEHLEHARTLLSQAHISGPFVLVHPAARWPFKCWEDESFARVIAHVLRKGFHVVLTCSPDPIELEMTRRMEQLARQYAQPSHSGVLLNKGGEMSLPLLTALLTFSQFYIGVDSAPMHMAAALDVPQVALFGPSWVNEWRPWSSKATVIYAGDYGPLPPPDSINTDDPTRLLKAIPLDAVIQAVDAMLNTYPAQPA